MNIKLRVRRWDFWLAVFGAVIAASGIEPSSLTSWPLVLMSLIDLVNNPFQLCGVAMAVIGIFMDYTTEGIGDSELAQSYAKPSPKTKEVE